MTKRTTARTTLRVAILGIWALAPPLAAQENWSWLAAEVSREQVSTALNHIWSSSTVEASGTVEAIRVLADQVTGEGRQAAGLLLAVALERAGGGQVEEAYQQAVDGARGTPYAVSASFRTRQLAAAQEGVEALKTAYATFADQPPAEGWFLLSDAWTWSTRRRAALAAQIDLNADRLSVRFFQYLRSLSPFAPPHAYLFILLALTIGVKFLELPLLSKAARMSSELRRLKPRAQEIQQLYAGDPVAMQHHMQALYRSSGINPASSCTLPLVDLIFVVWALVSFNSFVPQLLLDGASFAWIPDVTRWNLSLTIVWAGVIWVITTIATVANSPPATAAQLSCSSLITSALIVGISWRWHWPAYIFLFWMSLAITGPALGAVLQFIFSARS